jgi:hypothetical protein
MSLDFPASADALWALYDATGIRPEYAIVAMALESGLDPGITNSAGYAGLNQMSPGTYPDGYTDWLASEQISQVITPYWAAHVKAFGAVRSGTRLEQGNFYPASLKTARNLGSLIVSADGRGPASSAENAAAYAGNAGVFDPQKTGVITVQGVADALERKLGAAVQSAIAQTYNARPSESARDPVYGEDFGLLERHLGLAAGLSAAALAGVAFARPDLVSTVRRLLWR